MDSETHASPDSPATSGGSSRPSISSVTARLTALLERMAGDVTQALGTPSAAAAKEEFLAATGRVHEGDRIFDQRMAQFTEWFLLDRSLDNDEHMTPCVMWVTAERDRLSSQEISDARAMSASHRGVFLWAGRAGSGELLCDDLLGGMRWRVTVEEPPAGLSVGEVFEARLAGVHSEVHFTGAFCYHPPEVAVPLRRSLERLATRPIASVKLLETLMQWRLAYDRAEGTPAHRIYRLGDL